MLLFVTISIVTIVFPFITIASTLSTEIFKSYFIPILLSVTLLGTKVNKTQPTIFEQQT
jgi:hypothetical protein